MNRMSSNELRRAWLDFFASRGHSVVASSGLIPHHPTAPMFTNAGMNQFVPYFLGEEPAPFATAASVQKCVRTPDIDIVGTTTRHLTFFEMLGNFSFGDYFKEGAIRLAWELATEVLGFDGERIWATVYLDDDEAEQIWRDTVGLPGERVQRLGEADNFWEMQKGLPGPCGPNTELYYDRGPELGDAGGPAHGSDERYLEFWNLVFMQFNRDAEGRLADLPSKNVDTGAGFERNLVLLQGVETVFDTDVLRPLVECAERLTGTRYGAAETTDVSLRLMADHARTVSFLVGDGVFPSNEGRGYVLRRIIRRAVRHAYVLGVEALVMPDLVDTTMAVMGDAYPDLAASRDFVKEVATREEERFRHTLQQGMTILEAELSKLDEGGTISGPVAFKLHDTHGFPLELTQEIAAESGFGVDSDGFEADMASQRSRAKAARKAEGVTDEIEPLAELLDEFGPTDFTGRDEVESKGRVLGVLPAGDGTVWVVLDRTPFYAESGGQVGDTGTITAEGVRAEVIGTDYGVPGLLTRHRARITEGELHAGREVTATIDAGRRDAIRRNHTATHLLHWALRRVVGDHVKQQGSLVAPDRLRFDFSHYEALSPEQIAEVEDLVNADVLANHPARHYETTMDHARKLGAIAFFGDKYGEIVRVLEAGPHSTELCGGTHVRALGDIGAVKIVSEGSIGSNLRRIEAVSGFGPIERLRHDEHLLSELASSLGVGIDEVPGAVARRASELKEVQKELKALRQRLATSQAGELAGAAAGGVVVERVDGLGTNDLRDLALAVRAKPGIRAVVLGGATDQGRPAVVVATTGESGAHAGEVVGSVAPLISGGGNTTNAELSVAGGKNLDGIDAALAAARDLLLVG